MILFAMLVAGASTLVEGAQCQPSTESVLLSANGFSSNVVVSVPIAGTKRKVRVFAD